MQSDTLPETNGLQLKIGAWETTFVLGRPIFRGVLVRFREGNLPQSKQLHVLKVIISVV